MERVIKRDNIFILLAVAIVSTLIAWTLTGFLPGNGALCAEQPGDPGIYFFYSRECNTCAEILDELEGLLKEKYESIDLKTYEISADPDNLDLLFYMLDNYKNGKDEYDFEIPVIFIGDAVLMGEDEISMDFNRALTETAKDDTLGGIPGRIAGQYYGESGVREYFGEEYLTIPAVIVSALIDSINPCAIAVIIFLAGTLLVAQEKKNILLYGMVYIITIFIVYLGLGLGFVYFLENIEVPHLFFIIVGVVLIVAGLFSLKDFFWYGKGPGLGLPEPLKKIIERNVQKATIFSLILVGILISLFESACSGAIYLGILSLISRQGLDPLLFGLLVLYNFIFILPLLIILLVFYFRLPVKKIRKWAVQKKRNVYRLIGGIILILLGIYLIIWF